MTNGNRLRDTLLDGAAKGYSALSNAAGALRDRLSKYKAGLTREDGMLSRWLAHVMRQSLQRGEIDRAKRLAGRSNLGILRRLGTDFLREGKSDLALSCRRAAVDLSPADPHVRMELIRALFALGARGEALAEAQTLDLSYPSVPRHDLTPPEKLIYSVVENLAIASPELVANLVRSSEHVLREGVEGAFVECGVFRGGSAMAMMLALLHHDCADRDFFLYDTYSGMPEPEEIDVYFDGRPARKEWEEKKRADGSSGWVVSSLEDTRNTVLSAGYPAERVKFIQGLVEETIPGQVPEKIALLRLDTDFYRSTRHELDHLYPRLAHGGVLIIDDYGAFKGSQQAVDEYFHLLGIRPYLHRVDSNVRIFVKP